MNTGDQYPNFTMNSLWGTPTCLTGAVTTTIKNGNGCLHSVIVNTKGNGGSLLKLYDNTTAEGTLIANVDLTVGPLSLTYNCLFFTGLTAVLTVGTQAPNITLVWT